MRLEGETLSKVEYKVVSDNPKGDDSISPVEIWERKALG